MSRQLGDRSVFDRTHGPAVGASGDGLEGAYSAILNSAPSAGTVKVIVPNLWGLTTARSANCSPMFAGSPGDRVLLVFDEEKVPWVVSPSALARPTWTALPFASSWGNYGGPYQVGQYSMDNLGFVHLRGLIGKSTAYTSGETIFTLPVGYRPGGEEVFECMADDSAMGTMITRIDVQTNGAAVLYNNNSVPYYSSPGLMSWLTLRNVSFMQGN
jgi:hypothetical protein